MKLSITWIGKTKEPAIQALSDEYLKRLSHYVVVEGVALKDESALRKYCAKGAGRRSALVLLDRRGKQLSSEELANWIGNYRDRSPVPLVFAIGAASGFSDETRKTATQILSLGPMTLAHEIARVVLLEQLYRAFTILQGHPYHLDH
jgi:23S rRNA (pseudouridine1915-N3)-methyltransferase